MELEYASSPWICKSIFGNKDQREIYVSIFESQKSSKVVYGWKGIGWIRNEKEATKKLSPAMWGLVVVQSLRCVQCSATPWTAACQASLSFTISQILLKLMSIESLMPSTHLILCRPFLLLPSIFPSIRVFSNESALYIRWQSIGASASALPMNIQDWFTGLISLLSKGLSRVFSGITVQKHQFFSGQPSLWFNSHIHTWLLGKKTHSFDFTDLCWQSVKVSYPEISTD